MSQLAALFKNGFKELYNYWLFQQSFAQGIPKYKDLLSVATSNQLTTIQEAIQNDYVMAEIYFQTLNVVNIQQTPLLDVSKNCLEQIILTVFITH